LGLSIHFTIYLPLKKRKSSGVILLIASLGLMIFFDNLIQLLFGADVKILNVTGRQTGLTFGGVYITPLQIIILTTVFFLFIAFWLFKKFSKLGKLMQAVADNPELAKTSGINSINIQHWSFFIGSAIAGIAGILIALENNLEPTMGTTQMVSSFTGAVVGGVNSLIGSIIGSYFVGLLENFGVWFLPSGYKSAIAFVLLFIFLLIRPQGIFGIKKGTRE
jgi:branched-subunit amino acid ABC-type transport system permease component